jgi:anti-sigma factor RsiW
VATHPQRCAWRSSAAASRAHGAEMLAIVDSGNAAAHSAATYPRPRARGERGTASERAPAGRSSAAGWARLRAGWRAGGLAAGGGRTRSRSRKVSDENSPVVPPAITFTAPCVDPR